MKVLDFGTSSYRDVFLQTKCDEGCLKLAKLLGLDVSQWCNSMVQQHGATTWYMQQHGACSNMVHAATW